MDCDDLADVVIVVNMVIVVANLEVLVDTPYVELVA